MITPRTLDNNIIFGVKMSMKGLNRERALKLAALTGLFICTCGGKELLQCWSVARVARVMDH